MNATSSLVQTGSQTSTILTPHHKTFYQLQKKIEQLHKKKDKRGEELDECLKFYCETVRLQEKALLSALIERVRGAYPFYEAKKGFSKRELDSLKEVILVDIGQIFQMADFSEIPKDIKEIGEELEGSNYDEMMAEEFAEMKSEMKEMFEENGFDLDFSNIDFKDSQEEILRKMFESLGDEGLDKAKFFKEKPKTKKQLEKEAKQRVFEEMQKKSIGTIYKQLAKAFHPDLEQDPSEKIRKEELMKQLTAAYERNDLHALLAFEIEWMNSSQAKLPNGEELKVYNAIFRDQIKALEQEVRMLILQPKYVLIDRFFRGEFSGISTLEAIHDELSNMTKGLHRVIEKLKTPSAKKVLKEAIQDFDSFRF